MGGHVRPHPGSDVVVHRPQLVHRDPVLFHDRAAAVDQPLGVAALRRALEGAVDVQGTKVAKAVEVGVRAAWSVIEPPGVGEFSRG
jgi:hypothetical protein